MSQKLRQVRYIECDGCGYDLGERYTTLDLAYSEGEDAPGRPKGKLVFHFHQASPSHDCLRYWLTGTGILERSLKGVDLLSDRGREVILASVGGFQKKAS